MASPLDPYREALQQHGAGFEALLWNSREFQRTRFEVIVSMLDLTGRVIADIGCGHADLLAHLASRGVEYGRYIGVDGLPEMIECSRTRAAKEKLDEAVFHHADFAGDERLFESLVREGAEVFVFSGSLNTFRQEAALTVLERAWNALPGAGKAGGREDTRVTGALIFNFLSGSVREVEREPAGPAHRFQTQAMVDWALQRTPRIAARTDYFPRGHDATIAMFV